MKRKSNPRSGVTIASAVSQARDAGYRGLEFGEWLRKKRLKDRSDLVIRRFQQAYYEGMDRRSAYDRKAAEAAEYQQQKREAKAEKLAEKKRLHDWIMAQRKTARSKANPPKGRFDRCVKAMAKRGGAYDPEAVCGAMERREKNPAQESIDAYEEFHGEQPREMVTVTKKVHFHSSLAGAGVLKLLKVLTEDKSAVVTIKGFKGALLAFNEDKNQLFVEGGDQRLDLKAFGINTPHEQQMLGQVKKIGYFTDKKHLGDEGGEAVYVHEFRTTNENGKHIVVKIAEYPYLTYRTRDEQLEFWGGSYTIRAEGIDL
jgi:hypothetical protein